MSGPERLAASTATQSHDIVLMITTHRRAERFIPFVRDSVNITWPAHPACVFLTDGETVSEDVLHCENGDFVSMLLEGIDRIRKAHPSVKYLFHMLEDHTPLRPLDQGRVAAFVDAAVRHEWAAISFVTYDWPWKDTEQNIYEDGLTRTWRRIDTVHLDGQLFARVPKDFFRYFQVQPTLWRIDYFKTVLLKAKAMGVTDPWGFEALRLADAEQHYIADYRWPTVHHGFLEQGRINEKALAYIDGRSLLAFRRKLRTEFAGSASGVIFHATFGWRRAKRLTQRVRTRLVQEWRTIAGRP